MRRQLTFEEIHQYEVEMLKSFVQVCEAHDIRYYLCGGTLLGAIRHSGFIPWDDDIDILLPRGDYDRFLEYRSEIEAIPYYKVAAFELGNLNYPFCKIFDTRTEVDKTYILDETEKNLWIDILPMDGLPDDDQIIEKMFKKSLFARKIMYLKKAVPGTGKSKIKVVIKPVLQFFLKVISIQQVVGYIDSLSRTYNCDDCNYLGGVAMGYGPQEKMPKDDFLAVVKVPFEGMMLNAPKCYDYYLRQLYGEYMQLPPVEKRAVHKMSIWIEDQEKQGE